MNELFYPDIRLAKKEQLEWELFVKAGRVAEEQIDKGFVSQSIAQSVLATELLAVHTRHQASFTC